MTRHALRVWIAGPALLVLGLLVGYGFLWQVAPVAGAEATPVAPPEMSALQSDGEFGAAAVSSVSFNQTTYTLKRGTTVSATLTIQMSSTTANGTVEIFGLSSALLGAPASALFTGSSGHCDLAQQPTGGTVQVRFDSTGSGTCTIAFTISEDGAGFPTGRITAYSYVNFIPLDTVTANVAFVNPLTADSPTINVPYGAPYSGTLPAFGGKSPYAFSLSSQPVNGSVSLTNAATGAFTFTPAAGQSGSVSFPYSVTDSTDNPQVASGTVTLNIPPPPVVANDGTLAVPHAGQESGQLVASGGNGDLRYSETIAPTKGTVSIDPVTGAFTYTANPFATGSDSFTYRATDTSATPLSDTGVIAVTIAPPPLETSDLDLPVPWQGSVSDTILITGGSSPYLFEVQDAPLKGAVTLDDANGDFTYTAGMNQTGDDSFTVKITDGGVTQQTTTATVRLTIASEPLTTSDVNLDVAFEGSVDGVIPRVGGALPVTFAVSDIPDKGDVELDRDTGAFTYTARTNQTGTDTFVVTLTDSGTPWQTALSTVTITIGAPDALVTTTQTIQVTPGETISGDLNGAVTGGFPPYRFTPGVLPVQGDLTLQPDGTFTFVADTDATGTDSFTYLVTDSEQAPLAVTASVQGTVLITYAELDPTPTPTATATTEVSPTPSPTTDVSPTPSPTSPDSTSTVTPTLVATEQQVTPTFVATEQQVTSTPGVTATAPGTSAPTGTVAVPPTEPGDNGAAPGKDPGSTSTDTSGAIHRLPATGQGADHGSISLWLLVAIAGLLLFAAGSFRLRR